MDLYFKANVPPLYFAFHFNFTPLFLLFQIIQPPSYFFFLKTKFHKVLLWRLDDLIAGCVAGSFFHFDGVLSYSFEPAHPKYSLVSFSIKSAWNGLIQNSGGSVRAGREADPGLWCFTWLPSLLSLSLPLSLLSLCYLHCQNPPASSVAVHFMLIQRCSPPPTPTPCSPSLLPFPVFSLFLICRAESSYPCRALYIPCPCPL